jgi:hypothetical protein
MSRFPQVAWCVFATGALGGSLAAQPKTTDEAVLLAKSVDLLASKVRALEEETPAFIKKMLQDNDASQPSVKALEDHHRLHLETEVQLQRLLDLQFVLGKSATGKKTVKLWLAQADKVAPKLPKPPSKLTMPDFASIDKRALESGADEEKNAKTLGVYLGKQGKTDLEKLRAVFTWVTSNLAYDKDLIATGKLTEQLGDILTRRRTMCSGYALSMETLCRQAGLEAWSISGHARSLDYLVHHPDNYDSSLGIHYMSHAWNAVKIGGKMYVVDATFGGGRVYAQGKTTREWSTNYDYFLIPPEAAIASHIPKEERWQLLKTPVKRKDHESWPLVYPTYFAHNCRLESHVYPVAIARGQMLVAMDAPTDFPLYAVLRSTGKKPQIVRPLEQRNGTKVYFRMGFPEVGTYRLSIVTTADQTGDSRSAVVSYKVEAKEAGAITPLVYKGFTEKAYLAYPLRRQVPAARPQGFAIKIPKATEAYVRTEADRFTLEKRGDWFVGQPTLDAGAVRLYARFPEADTFTALLEFKAE